MTSETQAGNYQPPVSANKTDSVDVTAWNLNTLTFLPLANFNDSFTLNIRVTESRDGQTDAITSASVSVRVGIASDNGGNKYHSVNSENTDKVSVAQNETVSAKTASITVHSVLPNIDAQPKEPEVRYHVLNLASSRASEPQPIINWTSKAPDREISSTGWMPQLFACTKEKVRSLADITGLFFPSNREEQS
jgi:hypothetical protein